MTLLRWIVVGAVLTGSGGCRQILGLDDVECTPAFTQSAQYTTGADPKDPTVSDYNGDGDLDVAVINGSGPGLSIFLGNGDGTFDDRTDSTLGTTPTQLEAGDINGDGREDLLVLGTGAGGVIIVLGNGDGTFGTGMFVSVGGTPRTHRLSDLDRDGDLDFVAVSSGVSLAGIFLNDGAGAFATPLTYAVTASATLIEVADLDRDGVPDVIAGNTIGGGMAISTLLGDGDGRFQEKVDTTFTSNLVSLVIGDVDEDDVPDLLLGVVSAAGAADPSLVPLLGNRDGTFRTGIASTVAGFPHQLQDVNGDGHLDAVLNNILPDPATTGEVGVHLGNGDGTFGAMLTYPLATRPRSLVLVELDGKGREELLALENDSMKLTVLAGGCTY